MLIRLFGVFMHLLFTWGTATCSPSTRNLHAAFLTRFVLILFVWELICYWLIYFFFQIAVFSPHTRLYSLPFQVRFANADGLLWHKQVASTLAQLSVTPIYFIILAIFFLTLQEHSQDSIICTDLNFLTSGTGSEGRCHRDPVHRIIMIL